MLEKRIRFYTDGSCTNGPETVAYACVMVDETGAECLGTRRGSVITKHYKELWSVGGELAGAITALRWAKELGLKAISIHFDNKGIGCWALGEWKPKKQATQDYVRIYEECISSGMDIQFVKVRAHSGNKWNEFADKLANGVSQQMTNERAKRLAEEKVSLDELKISDNYADRFDDKYSQAYNEHKNQSVVIDDEDDLFCWQGDLL